MEKEFPLPTNAMCEVMRHVLLCHSFCRCLSSFRVHKNKFEKNI